MEKDEAEKICICPSCPTYVGCKETLAFCMYESGKSNCIKIEKDCLCPGCPVQSQEDFQHDYYCTRGGEKAQLE